MNWFDNLINGGPPVPPFFLTIGGGAPARPRRDAESRYHRGGVRSCCIPAYTTPLFFLLRAAGWYGTRRTFRYLYSCDVVVVVAGMKRERVFPSIAVTGCVLCAARPGAAAAALHYSIWTDPHIYTHWDTGKRLWPAIWPGRKSFFFLFFFFFFPPFYFPAVKTFGENAKAKTFLATQTYFFFFFPCVCVSWLESRPLWSAILLLLLLLYAQTKTCAAAAAAAAGTWWSWPPPPVGRSGLTFLKSCKRWRQSLARVDLSGGQKHRRPSPLWVSRVCDRPASKSGSCVRYLSGTQTFGG